MYSLPLYKVKTIFESLCPILLSTREKEVSGTSRYKIYLRWTSCTQDPTYTQSRLISTKSDTTYVSHSSFNWKRGLSRTLEPQQTKMSYWIEQNWLLWSLPLRPLTGFLLSCINPCSNNNSSCWTFRFSFWLWSKRVHNEGLTPLVSLHRVKFLITRPSHYSLTTNLN